MKKKKSWNHFYTLYKSKIINGIFHVKRTFQGKSGQLCGSVFKAKYDKIKHLKSENIFFLLFSSKDIYYFLIFFFHFCTKWSFCSVCVITHGTYIRNTEAQPLEFKPGRVPPFLAEPFPIQHNFTPKKYFKNPFALQLS